METMIGIEALKRCIGIIGSQSATARAVGRSQQAVSEIVRRGRRVPAEWCRPLEAATSAKGACVPAADLRPDLFAPISPIPIPQSREAAA